MIKINKLELRYYDNINRHLQKPELWDVQTTPYKDGSMRFFSDTVSKTVRNFYEYYIDGEMLVNIMGKYFDYDTNDYSSNFDHSVGGIGSFGDYQYNKILIKRLMLKPVSYKEISDCYADIEDSAQRKECIKYTKDELEHTFLLYCCQECGDRGCGGIGVEISKRKGCYFWTIGGSDKKLQFCFEYNQYTNALFKCMNQMRRMELANSLLTNTT